MSSQNLIAKEMGKSEPDIQVEMVYSDFIPSQCNKIFNLLTSMKSNNLKNYLKSYGREDNLIFMHEDNTLVFHCPNFKIKGYEEKANIFLLKLEMVNMMNEMEERIRLKYVEK